jgi:phosphoribosylamine--glycine ligase
VRVILVGNGGRECALAWRLAQSPSVSALIVTAPNPGWPARASLQVARDVAAIVALARSERPDLVVVGPEAPLGEGLADQLAAAGIACFGPTAAAARLETSKAFAKEIMQAAGVPTARALVASRADPASWEAARRRCAAGSVVIKADGLAGGKGVLVCPTAAEAEAGLNAIGRFGAASDQVLLEDLLTGPEVSQLALCDGERAIPLPSAQDHKRLGDGDIGPNTGGMGAYAPCPLVDAAASEALVAAVHLPVLREMARRGAPFRGILYAGLMLTPDGPRVLEFNVRFGDPECQPLMLLWEDDPLPWLLGAAQGALPPGRPRWRSGSALCVVLAAAGYPDAPITGASIPHGGPVEGGEAFVAGAQAGPDGWVSTGGRVLGITAWGADLREAHARAYTGAARWRFAGAQLRTDIGASAL